MVTSKMNTTKNSVLHLKVENISNNVKKQQYSIYQPPTLYIRQILKMIKI